MAFKLLPFGGPHICKINALSDQSRSHAISLSVIHTAATQWMFITWPISGFVLKMLIRCTLCMSRSLSLSLTSPRSIDASLYVVEIFFPLSIQSIQRFFTALNFKSETNWLCWKSIQFERGFDWVNKCKKLEIKSIPLSLGRCERETYRC